MSARARRLLSPGVLAMVLVVCMRPAQGQELPPDGRRPLPRGGGVQPSEIQDLFDAYVVMQAQQQLGLSEDQYARFLGRMKALQDIRRRSQVQRLQLLQEMRRRVLPAPGTRLAPSPGASNEDSDLRGHLKALADLDARTAEDVRQAIARIDEVLEVRQQARFRLFEEQMERRKIELLLRARQARRGLR